MKLKLKPLKTSEKRYYSHEYSHEELTNNPNDFVYKETITIDLHPDSLIHCLNDEDGKITDCLDMNGN